MKKNIRLLLVDDHQVVREGLRHMLEQEEDMVVVGQSGTSQETLLQVGTLSPDIILMDIKMPGVDGIELTRQIKAKNPSCNVIMLTLYEQYLTQAMEARASGYLLKDIKREELAEAIRQVNQGHVIISENITSQVRYEYEEGHDRRLEGIPSVKIEELQLVLPPPVGASQFMRFAGRLEDALQCRVLQVVGSWQEGTVMTIILSRAMEVADILEKLKNTPEVEAIEEKPQMEKTSPKLLKKVAELPRPRNRVRKTIFITLDKTYS